MEKWKWLCSVLLGFVTTFTQHYGLMILLVCIAIMFDFVTGLIKANITGKLSSDVCTKGFFKKMAMLICLFFGFFLDYAIPYLCSCVSIDIPFNTPFGLIICFYIVLNESISICENLYACNEDIMPKWIVSLLLSAKEQIDDMDGDTNANDEEK